MTAPQPAQAHTPRSLKACPFCGEKPQYSDYAIPSVVWCENKKCVLGPSRIMQDGFGKWPFEYENKYMVVEVWNGRTTSLAASDAAAERDLLRVSVDDLMKDHNIFLAECRHFETERDRLKAELAQCKALKHGLAHDSASFMCELQATNAKLLEALKAGRSALDKLMGDSDIEGDGSEEFLACQKISAAIAEAEGVS